MKWLLKRLQQWLCGHSTVRTSAKSNHKQNANRMIMVQCLYCEKRIYKKGAEVAATWLKERECHCTFEKENA